MKRLLSKFFFGLSKLAIKTKLLFYKAKNGGKKKVLIYTDSRGHEITKLTNKHNPFSGYSKYFIKNYKVDCYITPERHTTVYDFLDFIASNKIKYDYIICHVCVVGFAPRPLSQVAPVLNLKTAKISKLFGEDTFKQIQAFEGYPDVFMNEKTSSLVPEFMVPKIAEHFNKIPNLVWISCNPTLADWKGNYSERPSNLGLVNTKSIETLFLLENKNQVDLTKWSADEIRKYTCDNVHLTEAGMKFIENKLREIIEE